MCEKIRAWLNKHIAEENEREKGRAQRNEKKSAEIRLNPVKRNRKFFLLLLY